MTDTDEHRSVFAYVLGAALGGIALAVTAWVGLRGRRNGGVGTPRRPEGAATPRDGVDEDLV